MALVTTEVSDGVGVISFNRPEKHNAMSDEMVEHWREAIAWAARPEIRVVVVRGEGPSFCAGRDVGELGNRAAGESDEEFIAAHQRDAIERLRLPKPVIAAVGGAAIGGGLEIALSADIRIAGDDAKLGFPEIRFGLIPDTGGTVLTTMLAGPSRAKLMVMSGVPVHAVTALRWGLVDEVVPRADLDARVLELARALADSSPEALALAKRVIDDAWMTAIERGLRAELEAQTELFAVRKAHPRAGIG